MGNKGIIWKGKKEKKNYPAFLLSFIFFLFAFVSVYFFLPFAFMRNLSERRIESWLLRRSSNRKTYLLLQLLTFLLQTSNEQDEKQK